MNPGETALPGRSIHQAELATVKAGIPLVMFISAVKLLIFSSWDRVTHHCCFLLIFLFLAIGRN
jgi:hypothetical protein